MENSKGNMHIISGLKGLKVQRAATNLVSAQTWSYQLSSYR